MGLYSTNRYDSLSASSVEVMEAMESIDESNYNPYFGDIMETVIEIQENDQNMFDTLIECDFISAVNESVMGEDATYLNEASDQKKGESIKDKIVSLFNKIINAIKQAAQNIIYKIGDILKTDKRLYNEYRHVLTMENLKGFKGIANFTLPKKRIDAESLKSVKVASQFTAEFNAAVLRADSKDAIDAVYAKFEEKVEAEEQTFKNLYKEEGNDPQATWMPTDPELKSCLAEMNSASETIKGIKTHSANVMAELNKLKSEAKSAKKSGGNDAIEAYMLNKKYIAASKTCSLFSREFKAYTNTAIKQLAACRKVVIICGRYALKKSRGGKEEVQHNSAIDWAIGESSDLYVYETLGY